MLPEFSIVQARTVRQRRRQGVGISAPQEDWKEYDSAAGVLGRGRIVSKVLVLRRSR
jgi:hypothetical protein